MSKATIGIARWFNQHDELPYGLKDVMFIDVSHSSAMISDHYGTHSVPDREKLDSLFLLLKKTRNPKQVVVCDLYFDIPSDRDWKLQHSMSAIPNLLTAVKTNWQGEITPNVFMTGTSGTSGFRTIRTPFLIFSNWMFKYDLTDQNCTKTLPVLMYERTNNVSSECLENIVHIGNKWFFNTILMTEELGRKVPKAVYEDHAIPIHEVLRDAEKQGSSYIRQLKQKKFIVIGDFVNDIHKTNYGDKAGPMIIFDTFVALQHEENRITNAWVIMAVGFLTLLIFKKFYHFHILDRYIIMSWPRKQVELLGFGRLPLFDWFLFYLFVLVSAVFFQVYLETVAGLVFFMIMAQMRKYLKVRYRRLMEVQKSGRRVGARLILSVLFKRV